MDFYCTSHPSSKNQREEEEVSSFLYVRICQKMADHVSLILRLVTELWSIVR